jgi:trehalose-phosphatase
LSAAPLFGRSAREALHAALRPGPGITLVGLDCDGTLAPIAARPERARVPAATLAALRRCAALPRVRVVVLSARSISELRSLIRVPRVRLIGLHGLLLQNDTPARRARWRTAVARLNREAAAVAGSIRGAWLESKGLTFSLHYRLVRAGGERRKLGVALRRLRRSAARLGYRSEPGREVEEFLPRAASKLRSFRALLAATKISTAIYVGDSPGDDAISAFLAGPGRGKLENGLGVHVGRGATRAPYRVRGPSDVRTLLLLLIRARLRP